MALTRARHETCRQYLYRRISEGWQILEKRYPLILIAPPDGGCRRWVDLRNDVETLRPNAAGDECNLGEGYEDATCPNHYQNVDEESPDEDATYVKSDSTDYHRDLYNLDNSGVADGDINKITVYARLKKYGGIAPSRTIAKIAIKSGTGSGSPDTVDESAEITITTSWTNYSQEWSTNPATSSAWTWDEIDNLQAGVALKKYGTGEYGWCTQVYVEVDYTSAITEKTSSDSGSASDIKVSGNPLASFSQSDGGNGTEDTPAQEATLVGSETGSGMEAVLNLLGKLVSEAGVGAENSYREIVEGAVSSSDIGSGAEVSSLLAEFEQDETGEGAEALLTRLLHHADSGWGNDTVLTMLVALSGVEVGFSADSLLARLLAAGETGLGGDKLLSREVSLIDSGSGIETTAIYKILLATDGGSGLEALTSLLTLITSSEAGYSSEGFGAKIMTSPGASDMKLPTKKGRVGIPFKKVNL